MNNANLVRALVNNAWDKPVKTVKQARAFLEEKERLLSHIAYQNRKMELHINIPHVRKFHLEQSQILQKQLIELEENFNK